MQIQRNYNILFDGGWSPTAVREAILAARRIIDTGESRVVTVDMTNDVAAMEGMVCGGTMDVLIEDLPAKEN